MKITLRRWIQRLAAIAGCYLTSRSNGYRLNLYEQRWHALPGASKALMYLTSQQILALAPWLHLSVSQYGQDLLILAATNLKRNGFFVEFGAADGIRLSNTYLLEKEFAWSGILAEPCAAWRSRLAENRDCVIDFRCVSSASGSLVPFADNASNPLLSSIASVSLRSPSATTYVETISLCDLLRAHDAPSFIDILSIDVEGHESDILRAFDFARFRFGIVVVESNNLAARGEIRKIMASHSYKLFLGDALLPDEWFVGPDYQIHLDPCLCSAQG